MSNAVFLTLAIIFVATGLALRTRGRTISSMRKTGILFIVMGTSGIIYIVADFIWFIFVP